MNSQSRPTTEVDALTVDLEAAALAASAAEAAFDAARDALITARLAYSDVWMALENAKRGIR